MGYGVVQFQASMAHLPGMSCCHFILLRTGMTCKPGPVLVISLSLREKFKGNLFQFCSILQQHQCPLQDSQPQQLPCGGCFAKDLTYASMYTSCIPATCISKGWGGMGLKTQVHYLPLHTVRTLESSSFLPWKVLLSCLLLASACLSRFCPAGSSARDRLPEV